MSQQTDSQGVEAADAEQTHATYLWNRYFIVVVAASFVAGIVQHMMITALPLYILSFGANPSAAGFIMGVFAFAALVFRPVWGTMADQRGRRSVLLLGAAVVAVVSAAYGTTTVIWVILALRFFHGIGFSAYSTASGAVVADVVPKQRLTEGIGYFGLVNTAAIAIGPGLALWILGSRGYGSLFVSGSILAAAALAVYSFVNYERHPPAPTKVGRRQKTETQAASRAFLNRLPFRRQRWCSLRH